MTDHDRARFGEALGVLAETFNDPLSQTRLEAYFVALRDLPWPAVEGALRTLLRAGRWFPKPVEIREAVEGSPGDRAALAWGAVLEQVRRVGYCGTPTFTDPLTAATIDRLWGSWAALCETLPAGGPELVGWVKQFTAVYGTLATRAAHEAAQLPAARPSRRTAQVLAQVAALAEQKRVR